MTPEQVLANFFEKELVDYLINKVNQVGYFSNTQMSIRVIQALKNQGYKIIQHPLPQPSDPDHPEYYMVPDHVLDMVDWSPLTPMQQKSVCAELLRHRK